MAGELKNNMYLINAPAGSGKTTFIRGELKRICLNEPNSKVLCITYTKRAVEELQKDLNNPNVTACTIHSYINNLISPFYSSKEALDLYWDIFAEQIKNRISNRENDAHISQSNRYYTEKYGELSAEVIRANLTELSYGETSFTSLYSGKLSHDDLLMFANVLIKKYPILQRKISNKFTYIFIDEYQDTSAYILEIFYEAIKVNDNVKLYLLGDRMQQIYRNYDGSFEKHFKEFSTALQLNKNHRSVHAIVSILNNIYNDPHFDQNVSAENEKITPDIAPQLILSSNMKSSITDIQSRFSDILVLYLMNKEKYQEIGSMSLYLAYSAMDAYSFGRKYSPSDVLSDMTKDNPDNLMRFLFLLYNVMEFYTSENFGSLISTCKNEPKYFKSSLFKIKKHFEKKLLRDRFEALKMVYSENERSIGDVIISMYENGLINEATHKSFIEGPEYLSVLSIQIKELKNLAAYLNNPHISTQHGVKGESHTSVVFVAGDSNTTPNVRMYLFFELWSKIDLSLPSFEEFYYSYAKKISEVEKAIGMKTSQLNAETHNNNPKNKAILAQMSNGVLNTYKDNELFEALCKNDFIKYLDKPNVKNAKDIFNISKIEGILMAYKLFYVGCSRARKNLYVLVDENKIEKFREVFLQKMKTIGFLTKT